LERTKLTRRVLLAALLAAAAPALAQEGDPANGEKIFRRCAVCHTVKPDAPSGVGPTLYGVVGRTTGTVEGFAYSDALVAAGEAGHVWTPEEIALFIENPKQVMPGTKMIFAGLKKPEERADVVAYLESVGGGG